MDRRWLLLLLLLLLLLIALWALLPKGVKIDLEEWEGMWHDRYVYGTFALVNKGDDNVSLTVEGKCTAHMCEGTPRTHEWEKDLDISLAPGQRLPQSLTFEIDVDIMEIEKVVIEIAVKVDGKTLREKCELYPEDLYEEPGTYEGPGGGSNGDIYLDPLGCNAAIAGGKVWIYFRIVNENPNPQFFYILPYVKIWFGGEVVERFYEFMDGDQKVVGLVSNMYGSYSMDTHIEIPVDDLDLGQATQIVAGIRTPDTTPTNLPVDGDVAVLYADCEFNIAVPSP